MSAYRYHGTPIPQLTYEYLNTAQAAALAGCSVYIVAKAAEARLLPLYNVLRRGKPGRVHYFKHEEVLAWVQDGRPTVAPEPPVQVELLPAVEESVLDNLMARRLDRVEFALTMIDTKLQVLADLVGKL